MEMIFFRFRAVILVFFFFFFGCGRIQANSSSSLNSGFTHSMGGPVDPEGSCDSGSKSASVFRNIRYQILAGSEVAQQSLDVYTPATSRPCEKVPVVIWVHGGWYFSGDKSEIGNKANFYNSLGYVFVSINYRLSLEPEHAPTSESRYAFFPDQPNDLGAAVAWVRRNIEKYGGNPESIALAGHEAGAHLVALVSTNQNYLKRADPTWNSRFLKCTGSYDTDAYDIPAFLYSNPIPPDSFQIFVYLVSIGEHNYFAASPINHVSLEVPNFQFVRRENKLRRDILMKFSDSLERAGAKTRIIDGSKLEDDAVNDSIGTTDDKTMTPAVKDFMKTLCFPEN